LMASLTATFVPFCCCSSTFLLTTLSMRLSMFLCSTVGSLSREAAMAAPRSSVDYFFMAASNFAFAFWIRWSTSVVDVSPKKRGEMRSDMMSLTFLTTSVPFSSSASFCSSV
jgi:hypothetical protein